MRSLYLTPALNQALICAFSDRDRIDKGLETKEKYSPQEGIEPATYRMQVRRATHCAIWVKRRASDGVNTRSPSQVSDVLHTSGDKNDS